AFTAAASRSLTSFSVTRNLLFSIEMDTRLSERNECECFICRLRLDLYRFLILDRFRFLRLDLLGLLTAVRFRLCFSLGRGKFDINACSVDGFHERRATERELLNRRSDQRRNICIVGSALRRKHLGPLVRTN